MPHATTADGVKLYYESQGSGPPIVLVHELGGTYRSFDLQVAAWQGRFRCIAYNARGYPPSDVPPAVESYSQELAASDIGAVLDAAGLESAHVMGVSMGSAAALQFALAQPQRVRSVILCSIGSGSDAPPGGYATEMEARAAFIDRSDIRAVAENFANAPSRAKLKAKNPREYENSVVQLSTLSKLGLANTIRGVQTRRPPLYAHKDRIAAMTIPALVVLGADDEGCIKPSHFLKETLPGARLEVLAKTGHGVNLEEPALVNEMVERFVDEIEARRKMRA
jgi:pimeloyl-ACP methyl ester carboxylesterase